jgi:hypothetical protein
LATEEYLTLTPVLEGFVLLQKNPNYVPWCSSSFFLLINFSSYYIIERPLFNKEKKIGLSPCCRLFSILLFFCSFRFFYS